MKKRKATISLKKLRENSKIWDIVKGIEVQYSTDKSFAFDVKVKLFGRRRINLIIKGLKKKSIYYIRVRYLDGSGGYSKWSGVKKVKI